MARTDAPTEFDWTPVIGKALAFLCLHYADMRDKRVGDQAEFLARLGVPRAAAADLIGTSDASLRVLASQRAKRTSAARTKPAAQKASKTGGKGAAHKRGLRGGR